MCIRDSLVETDWEIPTAKGDPTFDFPPRNGLPGDIPGNPSPVDDPIRPPKRTGARSVATRPVPGYPHPCLSSSEIPMPAPCICTTLVVRGGQLPSAASALRRQNGHIMTSETTVSGTDHTRIASGKPGGFLEKSDSAAGAATAFSAIVMRVPGTVKSIFRPPGRFRPLRPTPPRDTNKRTGAHFCVTKRPSQASDNSETAGTLWRVRRRASGCDGLASFIRTSPLLLLDVRTELN